MGVIAAVIRAAERAPLPDSLALTGIDWLCGRNKKRLATSPIEDEAQFLAAMDDYPIAMHTDAANSQHYEIPAEFFSLILGPRRKYSCCLYPSLDSTLVQAEERALEETIAHADITDGDRILELGCGWGSLSLELATRFPRSQILSVSNSQSQRSFIVQEADKRSLPNLTIQTSDMNDFAPEGRFDRIVSVEMFEHMANWRALLAKARNWLHDDGRLFLHVFTHRTRSYRFDERDPADWIAQHFFTGGVMPARDLPHRVSDDFAVEAEWRWSGEQYRRTAMDWLANMDRNRPRVDAILRDVYGADAALWRRRWRLFFLTTAGLFGHSGGSEWGVGHYRLRPA